MTTAAERASDAKAVFRHFTESAADLIDCAETPEPVSRALLAAVTDIANHYPEDVDAAYFRRTLGQVFGLKAAKQRTLPRETVDRLQALGSAIAAVLEDEATPGWLFNALIEVTGDADNRASRPPGARREATYARRLFAESVLIAEEVVKDETEE